MTYVIAQPCVDLLDKACIEECPVDCIYEGNRMLYIHPDECVDCGACEPVCPVEAIFYEDDTPEQWKDYYKANVEFFDDLGSPGGAAKIGKIDKDHPLIAALPPQDPGPLTRAGTTGAAGPVLGPAARLPVGPARAVRRHAPARTPTASSTCRSARRSTRRPRSSAGRWRRPRTPRATRSPTARRRCARPSVAGSPAAGVTGVDPAAVLPTIGSKELVAWLPTLLGLGPGDVVVHPEVAYPTYDVGARLAGATPVAADGLTALGPAAGAAGLAELARPTRPGRVLPVDAPAQGRRLGARARRGGRLRRVLRRARLGGVGGARPPSVLRPAGLRRQPRGPARGPLAVQAVEPGRLPRGLRRRRPGARRASCSRCASTPA